MLLYLDRQHENSIKKEQAKNNLVVPNLQPRLQNACGWRARMCGPFATYASVSAVIMTFYLKFFYTIHYTSDISGTYLNIISAGDMEMARSCRVPVPDLLHHLVLFPMRYNLYIVQNQNISVVRGSGATSKRHCRWCY